MLGLFHSPNQRLGPRRFPGLNSDDNHACKTLNLSMLVYFLIFNWTQVNNSETPNGRPVQANCSRVLPASPDVWLSRSGSLFIRASCTWTLGIVFSSQAKARLSHENGEQVGEQIGNKTPQNTTEHRRTSRT